MSNSVDSTVNALHVALGQASRRAGVVASNLSNVDTPGYRALRVRFDDFLWQGSGVEAQRTDSRHLAGNPNPRTQGVLEEAEITRMRQDGNTVDIDLEMTRLAMTQGRFRTSAEMVRKRFALLMYAVTEGRG